MREDIQELDRAINDVALKWYYTPDSSSAQKQKYEYELAGLMMKYEGLSNMPAKYSYKNKDLFETAVTNFWVNRLKKWDPDKSVFSKYFNVNLNYSALDIGREERKVKDLSLDMQISEDSSTDFGDMQPDAESARLLNRIDEEQNLEEFTIDFIRQVVSMLEKCGGRVTSPERKLYFSIRYTDIISKFIREEQTNPCRKHEDEMLALLRKAFLDYTSDRVCRSVPEIAASHVKPYCQLVDNRPEETQPPKQTFRADVYLAYIDKVENRKISDSALSLQKKAFDDILKDWNKKRQK